MEIIYNNLFARRTIIHCKNPISRALCAGLLPPLIDLRLLLSDILINPVSFVHHYFHRFLSISKSLDAADKLPERSFIRLIANSFSLMFI